MASRRAGATAVALLGALALLAAACGSTDPGEGGNPATTNIADVSETLAAGQDLPTFAPPILVVDGVEVPLRALRPFGQTVATVADSEACSVEVDTVDALQSALSTAAPGDILCLSGDHAGAVIEIDQPGEDGRSITVVGRGATVGAIDVFADHITVSGFDLVGTGSYRPAVDIDGVGIVIDDLTITEPGGEGISCGSNRTVCADVVISDNVVTGVDGTGISIFGQRNTITGNEVSGSVRVESNDADGIRFFGTDHRIIDNLVHSIFDRGYDGEGPHTDCFQTFDNSKPPTVGTLIEGNVCFDVDHQCLIASAEESGNSGDIGRSGGITFRNNICANNGSQGLLLREFPGSTVTNNLFAGTIEFHAVFAHNQTTDLTVTNNVFLGDPAPYYIDDDSLSGFLGDHNAQTEEAEFVMVDDEPNGLLVPSSFGFTLAGWTPLEADEGSPLVDAGVEVPA
ncbi:MAG: right-handed parallel beta-helix repeat-containing protein [Actinomycetota bacterium]